MLRLLSLLLILAACAPRPGVVVVAASDPPGPERSVFFATARAPESAVDFGAGRSLDVSFGAMRVSIPPAHDTGRLELARGRPDPARSFAVIGAERHETARDFSHALAAELASQPAGAREVVLFLHGFNTTFAEGVFRTAQITTDFGISGVPVHYSWPSLAQPLGYAHDRDSVLFARAGVSELIRAIDRAGARRVLLIGHSLGAQLAMEGLRDLALSDRGTPARLVDSVILISPDIDVDVFRAQARDIGALPRPFVIFASERDRALALSARLTGETNRLGSIDSAAAVSGLPVTVIDVTGFSGRFSLNHFSVAESPSLIALLRDLPALDRMIEADTSGRIGPVTATMLTVQQATEIILSPLRAVVE